MNLQSSLPTPLLKIILVNPLSLCGQLLAVKILSGSIFGKDQRIHLTLLLYHNEIESGEHLKIQLENCAFDSTVIIEVTSQLLCISGIDIICIVTNFLNPNYMCLGNMNDDEFDALNAIIKFADTIDELMGYLQNKDIPTTATKVPTKVTKGKSKAPKDAKVTSTVAKDTIAKKKVIIITDGIVALNVFNTFTKFAFKDSIFCSTSLVTIAKKVLGDHIKVLCSDINDVLVWAADDRTFHIEIMKPVVLNSESISSCDNKDIIGQDVMAILNMDYIQFNSTWMRKEFVEKVNLSSLKNTYGPICKAFEMAFLMKNLWNARKDKSCGNIYVNMGVVSDGSYGTIKNVPYVLPVILSGDTWKVNKSYERDCYVMQEMKKVNFSVKEIDNEIKAICHTMLHERDSIVTSTSSSGSSTLIEFNSVISTQINISNITIE